MALLLFSCQSQESPDDASPKKGEEKTTKPIYIGTVHQIYPAHNFALVRLARDTPRVGVTLISHPVDGSNQRLGNMIVSAEKVDNTVSRMIAADIRSGTVMRGDAVYIYADLAAKAPKTQDTPTAEPSEALGTQRPQGFQVAADDITPPWMVEGSGSATPTVPSTPSNPSTPSVATVAPTPTAEPVNTGVTPPKQNKASNTPDPEVPDFIKKIPDSVDGWENL